MNSARFTLSAAPVPGPDSRCASRPLVLIAALLPALFWLWPGASPADTTLRDYVAKTDPAYGYRHTTTVTHPGCTIHVLSMTSQRWRSSAEVSRTLWQHWMAVVVPDTLHSDIAMLIVEGGMNLPFRPSLNNPVVAAAEHIALATGTVVVVLGQVPNEPLYFSDAPGDGLNEDQLVAFTWARAMDSGDYTWPAYVPMVKSVVRAMDTVQSYMAQTAAHPVQHFVLVGFSKRGAATWLTSAVDARVMAFAAGIFDILDIVAQLEHHYAAYGRYSSVMHAYLEYGVVRRLRSPEGEVLLHVVDPYYYLDDIQQPKLLINATGDPFFLPDAALQYVRRLRGETLLRYVPNADHSLTNRETGVMDLVDGLISWYRMVLARAPRPHIVWSVENGRLTVRSDPPPLSMRLWQADNPTSRDFRKQTIGETWKPHPLDLDEHGAASTVLQTPAGGWRAAFAELLYPSVAGLPQIYSTPVFILPNTLPHEVTDAIVQPRDADYWRDQIVRAARGDLSAEIGATQLKNYLPLPLFDAYVRDLATAGRIMQGSGPPAAEAQRQCLATRLNIQRRQLGWYTRLRLDEAPARYLWEYYREAHAAYLRGEAGRAHDLCRAINGASPSALPRSAGPSG